jgi:hypothetical protein
MCSHSARSTELKLLNSPCQHLHLAIERINRFHLFALIGANILYAPLQFAIVRGAT